jgi:beta-glucanase (GH16 family)
MSISQTLPLASVLFLMLLTKCVSANTPEKPPGEGLVLWLDASDPATLKSDEKGHIIQWQSKVGEQVAVPSVADKKVWPLLVDHAVDDKPAVRFDGRSGLVTAHPIREKRGAVTVFVVFQRLAEQASEQMWQRLVSAQIDPKSQDNQTPNFCLLADSGGQPRTMQPTIVHGEFGDAEIGLITIGSSANHGNSLHGDVCEVLIYDRGFLSEGEQRLVLDYLHAKWKAAVTETGWTRTGDLGPTPAHARQDLPLSDQANQGAWALDAEFSDEFDAPQIDMKRWHLNPTSPGDWKGRPPAPFLPSNVVQKDGMLQLTFRKDDLPGMKRSKEYGAYSSALIRSNGRTGYGYYEIRAKPMPSAASSSFWFTDTGIPNQGTELDVFETGAKASGFERKYNMNAHVWKTPQETRHWSVGGVWKAPWNLGDDFHVYGFDWSKDELVWYVDGVAVRRAKNTNWFFPMQITFDTEAMFSWFGKVDNKDLPSTFTIDYLRVWRRPAANKEHAPQAGTAKR